MAKGARMALWSLIALLALTQGVSTVLLYGEIAELRLQIEIATGARPSAPEAGWSAPALPTPLANVGGVEAWGSTLTVRALGAHQPLSATTAITLVVRGSGAVDPLQDLPVLVCDGVTFPVEGASLEKARQDALALITQGVSTTTLHFMGAPDLQQTCTVLLNPNQAASNGLAPRMEVPLPRLAVEEHSE